MMEAIIETEMAALKEVEEEKHFKAGLIDFTAGSLGMYRCYIIHNKEHSRFRGVFLQLVLFFLSHSEIGPFKVGWHLCM